MVPQNHTVQQGFLWPTAVSDIRVSEFDYPKQEIAYYMGLLCYFPAVSPMAKPIGAGSSAHQAASLEP